MVTSASGCESTADTVVVTVDNATPTANAGSDATIDCNNTSAVIGAPAVSGFTYAWTPSTGLNGQYAHPTATPNTTTTYTLVITNSSTGCTASDTVVVTVDNATPTANAGSDATIDCNTTSVVLEPQPYPDLLMLGLQLQDCLPPQQHNRQQHQTPPQLIV